MKKLLYFILLSVFLLDTGYSFLQFYNTSFDGDMAGGIVPIEHVLPVLNNPLGYQVIMADEPYANPNRFFSHWSFYTYFNHVPTFVSNFISPISAAYFSAAFAKTAIQLFLIYLLAVLVSGNFRVYRIQFLFAILLIFPFFQANGYRSYMGIIDNSTTYTFFYALPFAVLLLYFTPFFLKIFYNRAFKRIGLLRVLWIPLALITSLSGPLNPGIALVVCFLLLGHKIFENSDNLSSRDLIKRLKFGIKALPKDYYYFLLPIIVFSLYSLFIGSYNSINTEFSNGLGERYSRLPEGIFNQFTQKAGFPILLLALVLNSLLIHYRFKSVEGVKILRLFKWIGFFSILYLLLLPLGGFREYRPNVLRYDTILPITIALIFIFAKTSFYIFQRANTAQRTWYSPIIILVLFVFTIADKPEFDSNDCERNALEKIARSTETKVDIEENCTVLSWELIENYSDSELNAELLMIWGITNEKKLYRNGQ